MFNSSETNPILRNDDQRSESNFAISMMTTRSMKKKAEAVSPETNKTATENELNITKLTPLGKTRKAMKVEKELNEDDSVATFDFNYEEGNKKTPYVQIKNENFDELLKKRGK